MLLYTMLYIVLAYLMLFAALTNSVCLNNASFFFLLKYFLCQGYELSGEIALKNNHYYYYYYVCTSSHSDFGNAPWPSFSGVGKYSAFLDLGTFISVAGDTCDVFAEETLNLVESFDD